MQIAITHEVSPKITDCELTFMERAPIDLELAKAQYLAYCDTISKLGAKVIKLSKNLAYPDCSFVEDVAIVLDELGIITSMGAESRRGEQQEVRVEIEKYRKIAVILPPANIEGGDVLRIGKTLFVGLSTRTNKQGVEALRIIAAPHGYEVISIEVPGCLHLKTGMTAIDEKMLLANKTWVNVTPIKGFKIIDVPNDEPWGGNILKIQDQVIAPASCPKTIELIKRHGINVHPVDISEFQKAEAGLTCMSIVFSEM